MLTRFQNPFRTRSTRAVVMPIVLAFTVLLGATPALAAQPVHVPLAGQDHRFFGPVRSVRQVGNWVYFTGQQLSGPFDFGALAGTEYQIVNARLNVVTGSGSMAGTVTYVDFSHHIFCVAAIQGTIAKFVAYGTVRGRCSDGAVLKLDLKDIAVTPGVDGRTNYWGELIYK